MEPSAPAAGTSNSSNELTKLAELEQEVAEAEQRVISGKVNTFVHPPGRLSCVAFTTLRTHRPEAQPCAHTGHRRLK